MTFQEHLLRAEHLLQEVLMGSGSSTSGTWGLPGEGRWALGMGGGEEGIG